MVERQQQKRLDELRLNGGRADGHDRLAREDRRALRHGPDVAPEPEKLQSLVTKAVEKNRMERRQKAHALNLKRLFDTLTTAEKNISYQLAKGLSNPQIAKLLGISERTVQTHRARVYGKLDIENPVELNDFLHEMEEA